MDILRSGKLPEELKQQGVTMDMLRQYGAEQDKYMFARTMKGQGLSKEVEGQMAAFQEKGWGSLRDAKGKVLKGDALKSAFGNLAQAARAGGHGKTLDEAGAFLRQRAASEDPELMKALTKGGIGVSVGADELAQKTNADFETLRRERAHKQQKEAIEDTGVASKTSAQKIIAQGTNLNGSVSAVTTELNNLATAIATARKAIQNGQPGRSTAKAP
jgi:hypothetical protein